jgi:hypothetical protein
MDSILAILTFLLVLTLEIAGVYVDLPFTRKLRLREIPMISKIMTAFLAGFIVFALFTDRIPMVQPRVSLIITCLSLIFANLFLRKKEEDIDV